MGRNGEQGRKGRNGSIVEIAEKKSREEEEEEEKKANNEKTRARKGLSTSAIGVCTFAVCFLVVDIISLFLLWLPADLIPQLPFRFFLQFVLHSTRSFSRRHCAAAGFIAVVVPSLPPLPFGDGGRGHLFKVQLGARLLLSSVHSY